MKVSLKMLAVAVLAMFMASSANAQDEKRSKRAQQTPEDAFKRMDADGDGKLTKAEYTKWAESQERMAKRIKEDPKFLDTQFERMDGNKDGKVTLEEYKKYRETAGSKRKKTPPSE